MRGYITALGGPLLVLVLLAVFIAVEAARVAAQLWLQHWTGEVDRTHGGPGCGFGVLRLQ